MPERPDLDYQLPYIEPAGTRPLPTPLAIIVDTMHGKLAKGDSNGAVALARLAAPYLHAHLPAALPATELAAMPDADLDALKAQD